MKVLIIGDANASLLSNQYEAISETIPSATFDVLNTSNAKCRNDIFNEVFEFRAKQILDKVPYVRKKYKDLLFYLKLKKVIYDYDIIHFHYLSNNVEASLKILRRFKGIVYIHIWGSDFYRRSEKGMERIQPFLERADKIFFTNPSTIHSFKKVYSSFEDKLKVLKFGLKPLDYLLDEPKTEHKVEKHRITIGYNTSPHQHHLEILDNLEKNISLFKDREIELIFPLTYGSGSNEYVTRLKKRIRNSSFKTKIIDTYLSDNELAKVRVDSDIFIQLQTTDQLSGTMTEYMATGNVVITGGWLPYSTFKDLEIQFLEVNKINQIAFKLHEVMENYADFKYKVEDNHSIIIENFSIKASLENWTSIYI